MSDLIKKIKIPSQNHSLNNAAYVHTYILGTSLFYWIFYFFLVQRQMCIHKSKYSVLRGTCIIYAGTKYMKQVFLVKNIYRPLLIFFWSTFVLKNLLLFFFTGFDNTINLLLMLCSFFWG